MSFCHQSWMLYGRKLAMKKQCHCPITTSNAPLIYEYNFFHIAFEIISYDYSQLCNHLKHLVIDFLIAKDIIPFVYLNEIKEQTQFTLDPSRLLGQELCFKKIIFLS